MSGESSTAERTSSARALAVIETERSTAQAVAKKNGSTLDFSAVLIFAFIVRFNSITGFRRYNARDRHLVRNILKKVELISQSQTCPRTLVLDAVRGPNAHGTSKSNRNSSNQGCLAGVPLTNSDASDVSDELDW